MISATQSWSTPVSTIVRARFRVDSAAVIGIGFHNELPLPQAQQIVLPQNAISALRIHFHPRRRNSAVIEEGIARSSAGWIFDRSGGCLSRALVPPAILGSYCCENWPENQSHPHSDCRHEQESADRLVHVLQLSRGTSRRILQDCNNSTACARLTRARGPGARSNRPSQAASTSQASMRSAHSRQRCTN